MSIPTVTERHVDQMYTIIETLSVCSIVLSNGDVTDNTASSISWLTGQMKIQALEILGLIEEVQQAQLKGGAS